MELYHHGILGQKWGIRRYQNEDGTLTEAGRKRLEKEDNKWAKKNHDKIMSVTKKQVYSELSEYGKQLASNKDAYKTDGTIKASVINEYNRKMAELMTEAAADISAPSGRAVKFVAKRGSTGVMMALSDRDFDINQFKNGIWSTGRVAYRKEEVNKVNI